MHKTLLQHVRRANDDHVVSEMLMPLFFRPEAAAYFTTDAFNALIKIALKNVGLLKDKLN